MTPWVLRLLVANVAIFLATRVAPGLVEPLVLLPDRIVFRPWTLVTYMFLHANIPHILFNMLGLWFAGPRLEARLGGMRFVWLYLWSGIAGALLSLAFTPHSAVVGASGAIFGVLLGFARYWPEERIFVWGVFPMQARVFVVLLTVLALFGGFGATHDNIAHFAHLGGFAGGFLYLKWAERRSKTGPLRARPISLRPRFSEDLRRWSKINRDGLHEVNREEFDRIMEKIRESGVSSLSPRERLFLDNLSAR